MPRRRRCAVQVKPVELKSGATQAGSTEHRQQLHPDQPFLPSSIASFADRPEPTHNSQADATRQQA